MVKAIFLMKNFDHDPWFLMYTGRAGTVLMAFFVAIIVFSIVMKVLGL
jgi:hypothetical protein